MEWRGGAGVVIVKGNWLEKLSGRTHSPLVSTAGSGGVEVGGGDVGGGVEGGAGLRR